MLQPTWFSCITDTTLCQKRQTALTRVCGQPPLPEARKLEHDRPPSPKQEKTSINHPTSMFQPVGVYLLLWPLLTSAVEWRSFCDGRQPHDCSALLQVSKKQYRIHLGSAPSRPKYPLNPKHLKGECRYYKGAWTPWVCCERIKNTDISSHLKLPPVPWQP